MNVLYITPGSTATITASSASAAFVRWHGDVPAGHETDAVLQLVMDGPKSLIAEFATDWVYSANKVTDGYWTLNVSGSQNALTVGKPTASASHGHLDLTKPIVGGGAFVAIGGQAFENSTATQLVDLPDTVTSIGANAFQRNTSLTRIRLSANLQSIGDSAFYQSTALAEVVPFLPASTVNFGYNCFNGCEALGGSLVLASGGGATRFSLSYQGTGAHFSSTAITNVTLGAGVTNLPVACFMRCYSLRSARLNEALAEIGNEAFYQCTALEDVEPFLPAKTRTLGYQCFAGCTSLQGELSLATAGRRTGVVFALDWRSNGSQFAQTPISAITLGAGVSTLPADCFHQCRSVREVTFMGAAPAISSTAFGSWNQNQSVLRLPKGEPTWDAWIGANVTPWDSLDATARSAYAARWPDGKTPVGRTTSSAYPAQQYVLRWSGRGATTVIVVQ